MRFGPPILNIAVRSERQSPPAEINRVPAVAVGNSNAVVARATAALLDPRTTAQAWERGYEVVIVNDATSSRTAEMYTFSIKSILPRISRITNAANIGFNVEQSA